MTEIANKLAIVRAAIARYKYGAVRLRGVDWFAWATAGLDNVVILTTETGIAELVITADQAFIVTDSVEVDRLRDQGIPTEYQLWATSWTTPHLLNQAVREWSNATLVASDRPGQGEVGLPPELVAAKLRLVPEEIARYQALGRTTAQIMTKVLSAAKPEWTEFQLAGAAAAELWSHGIHPALTLVGGERRLPLYGHLPATHEPIGQRAMLVVCARQGGLYANVSRYIHFRPETAAERASYEQVIAIEAEMIAAAQIGSTVGAVYDATVVAYTKRGVVEQMQRLHQGGTTGYRSREVVARPGEPTIIEANTAMAWNPSLAGVKIEDTIIRSAAGVEVLSVDPAWPSVEYAGLHRALPLVI